MLGGFAPSRSRPPPGAAEEIEITSFVFLFPPARKPMPPWPSKSSGGRPRTSATGPPEPLFRFPSELPSSSLSLLPSEHPNNDLFICVTAGGSHWTTGPDAPPSDHPWVPRKNAAAMKIFFRLICSSGMEAKVPSPRVSAIKLSS